MSTVEAITSAIAQLPPDQVARVRAWLDERERLLAAAPPPIQPRDEWERRLLGLAKDCGVSLSNDALSREALYD